jgi:hypothetical protein
MMDKTLLESNAQESVERPIAATMNRSQQSESWHRALLQLIESAPIEDGYSHPAEELLAAALRSRTGSEDEIQRIYLEHRQQPAMAAAILRFLGRLDRSLVGSWGMQMAISSLSHDDLEVREAAVRALEMWGGDDALQALRAYVEAEGVPWLADYTRQVIADLSK